MPAAPSAGGRTTVSQELIAKAVAHNIKPTLPQFKIGDTVNVSVRIVEGDKERIQVFTGVVIARKGSGMGEMFTVRRIVNNQGVERTFPMHSPKVSSVEVVRGGRTRRAKLYYLRERTGKATRLRQITRQASAVAAAAEQPAAESAPESTTQE
ncbi:MAG: 50S ribosomal protein L19 [Phycisphaerae bacterium]